MICLNIDVLNLWGLPTKTTKSKTKWLSSSYSGNQI
jgi:hypothetical protein